MSRMMERSVEVMMVSTVVASCVAVMSCAESAGVNEGTQVIAAQTKRAKVESVEMDLMGLR